MGKKNFKLWIESGIILDHLFDHRLKRMNVYSVLKLYGDDKN